MHLIAITNTHEFGLLQAQEAIDRFAQASNKSMDELMEKDFNRKAGLVREMITLAAALFQRSQ